MYPRKEMTFESFKVNENNHKLFDNAYNFSQGEYPLLMLLGDFQDIYHLKYAVVNELENKLENKVIHLNMDEWNEQLVNAIKGDTMSEYNSRMKNY